MGGYMRKSLFAVVCALMLLPCAAFARSKYVKSEVYEQSLVKFQGAMLRGTADLQEFKKFPDVNEKGLEEMFLIMHEVGEMFLGSHEAGKYPAVFDLENEWNTSKSYMSMDVTEYVITHAPIGVIQGIIDYGKLKGKNPAKVLWDDSNIREGTW